ncbi:MAG: RNA pseudouridine synthase [Bacilli bacterium]|nr:RNA pseudouridine synthase [Bacilli bacterium]
MKKTDKLKIIYEDKYLLVVDKPNNLLTVSNEKESENTLFHKVYLYIKRKNKNQKIFIVHRLDYDTSGLVVFAKSEKVKKQLQDNWDQVIRKYMAIVHGNLETKSGTIKSYLKMTKTQLVYSTNDSKNGKLAITSYKTILENKKYSLLDIDIKTGRKNQIRVHLNDLGYPILGDKKYSSIKDKAKRMYLHAYYLEFTHPITNNKLKFELDVPTDFLNTFNKV